jgi:hypothetical protein
MMHDYAVVQQAPIFMICALVVDQQPRDILCVLDVHSVLLHDSLASASD